MLDFVVAGLSANSVPYIEGLDLQRAVHRAVVAGERPDTVTPSGAPLRLHRRQAHRARRAADRRNPGHRRRPRRQDHLAWPRPTGRVSDPPPRRARSTSSATCADSRACSSTCSPSSASTVARVDGRSGVWVGEPGLENKIAAIGIRVADGVTMHGFALNCSNSLDAVRRDRRLRHPRCRHHDDQPRARPRRSPPKTSSSRSRGASAPRPRPRVGRRMSTAPEGRRMLRLEVRNAQTPIERKPEWIKTRAKMGPEYRPLQTLVKSEELHTVCQEAGCPNIYECWEDREATFLIGGSPVHAPLRLLPDRHRQARRLRHRRAAPGRRVGRADAAALLDRHGRRPRRPARRGRVALRRDDPRDPPPVARHRRRDPRARLLGQPRPPRRGVLGAARGVRAQRRDGAAHLQAHPPGVPLRALARRDHAGPRRRPDHQVEPHPRHGRGAR